MMTMPLSVSRLEKEELKADKKACRRVGPCGVGKKALYLNSFFIDRCYYIPYAAIRRVFKRVAMSEGGFSGKGVFASMAYLVVEYDDGSQKQCNFKYEQQVDDLLAVLKKEQPRIPQISEAAAARLAQQMREKEEQEASKPELTKESAAVIRELRQAQVYLERKPGLSQALSQAARRRRNYECTSPSYRWVAMAITALGAVAMVYGIYSFIQHGTFGVYFTLFGFAAIFTFAGFSILPTARNNKSSILRQQEKAGSEMEAYLAGYPEFPVPARYAHPVVLERMCRAVELGQAATASEALEVVKRDLKALNADVQVTQEEYDEVVAIKAMFLNANYQ